MRRTHGFECNGDITLMNRELGEHNARNGNYGVSLNKVPQPLP